MPRRIFSFDEPDRFVCGTVGEPGRRTFYLQATKGGQVVSVALEKVQVAVLAERLSVLLLSLRQARGGEDAVAGAANADAPSTRARRPSGSVSPFYQVAPAAAPDTAPLSEPVIELFRVGTLALGWDGERERVVIEARELRETGSEADDGGEDEDEIPDDSPIGPDVVRVRLTADEAEGFVTRAMAVVRAGRPPCPMCGQPLDPGGHFCVRRNGYTH